MLDDSFKRYGRQTEGLGWQTTWCDHSEAEAMNHKGREQGSRQIRR